MAITASKNYSLVAIVLIIACLVTGYFMLNTFLPGLNQAKAAKMRIEQTNADLKSALASEKTFLKNFESQSDNVKLANLILPTGTTDMSNFVTNLSTLATASGVSLSNFAVSDPNSSQKGAQANSIQAQDLSFSASGNYPSMKNFLISLESSSRLVDISRVVLAAEDKSQASNNSTLQYQIKLHTYFQQ